MTIEKEAREIVFKYFDAMTDRQINSGKVRGIEEFIADALQVKQDRIDELESALREIHRLCRTLEPIDATMRIIQVKEKAIGYGK